MRVKERGGWIWCRCWLRSKLLLRIGAAQGKKADNSRHGTASALIMFPTVWWLGPLRWWVPWVFQAGVAQVGRMAGYRALMEKYTQKEEWEEYVRAKRA